MATVMMTGTPGERARERILAAAERLLSEGGAEAVSTRAVSVAAGVQSPTIYRHFGDKQGLLDAVANVGFTRYLDGKGGGVAVEDPLEDLRRGWDLHVGFGLANPYLYALVYGDPSRHADSPTAAAAARVVAQKVHRLAGAGLLRTSEERAVQLLIAAGSGTTLALIATPAADRDPGVSDLARDACVTAITTAGPPAGVPGRVGAAAALRADLSQAVELTSGEKAILAELLDRVVERGAR